MGKSQFVISLFCSAVTNAFFVSLHGLLVGPFTPLDHARSASQSPRSSRAVIQIAASAAGFRLRLGGGVALRLRSGRLSACAPLFPLADRRPKLYPSRTPLFVIGRFPISSYDRPDCFPNYALT
jgi:hypothetical protein